MADATGHHRFTFHGLFTRIPMRNTTKSSSAWAVYVPGKTLAIGNLHFGLSPMIMTRQRDRGLRGLALALRITPARHLRAGNSVTSALAHEACLRSMSPRPWPVTRTVRFALRVALAAGVRERQLRTASAT